MLLFQFSLALVCLEAKLVVRQRKVAEKTCSFLRKQHVEEMEEGAELSKGRHVGAADGG